MTEKRRLGRGLDALLGGTTAMDSTDAEAPKAVSQAPAEVPVAQIQTNPHQPRKDFDPEELAALQRSLQTHGLIQPIVVRTTEAGYELVAGERRLRAARECGWENIPVRIVNYNDREQFEVALVENLQRADLNPIEKAQGFQEYMRMYSVTQEEVARKMGLDRSTISNLIRLLELPSAVQDAVRHGQISNGHAKALLAFDGPDRQVAICKEILAKGLSVRAVEAMTQETETTPSRNHRPSSPSKTRHVQSIEHELKQALATKVEIRLKDKDRGQIVIDFETNDDFERLIELLGSERVASR